MTKPLSIRETLQKYHPDTLGETDPVGAVRKGLAPSVARKTTLTAELNEPPWRR
jgi:hypothetical protein